MNITLGRYAFKSLASLGVVALMIAAPAVSRAATVYNNFNTGHTSNKDGNEVGNDRVGDNLAEGDTFTPSFTSTFLSLEIALSCWGTCANPFSVDLVKDSAGSPDTTATGIIEAFTVLGTSLSAPATTNFITLTAVGSPHTLTSGTPYWIVVLPDAAGTDEIQWNWNTTGDSSFEAVAFAGGGAADTWYELGQTPGAYEVDGNTGGTPEPGTLGMMLGGGLLLGLLRKVRG